MVVEVKTGLLRYFILLSSSYFLFPWILTIIDVNIIHKELLRMIELSRSTFPSLQWISIGLSYIDEAIPKTNSSFDLSKRFFSCMSSIVNGENVSSEAMMISISVFIVSLSITSINGNNDKKRNNGRYSISHFSLLPEQEAHALVSSKLSIGLCIYFAISQTLSLSKNDANQLFQYKTDKLTFTLGNFQVFESYTINALFASLLPSLLVVFLVTSLRCLYFLNNRGNFFATELSRFTKLLSASIAVTTFVSMVTCFIHFFIAYGMKELLLKTIVSFLLNKKKDEDLKILFLSSSPSTYACIISLATLLIQSSLSFNILPGIVRDAYNQATEGVTSQAMATEGKRKLKTNVFYSFWTQLDSNIKEASLSLHATTLDKSIANPLKLEVNAQWEIAKALIQSSILQEMEKDEGKEEKGRKDVDQEKRFIYKSSSSLSTSVLDQVFPHPFWPIIALFKWFLSSPCAKKRFHKTSATSNLDNHPLSSLDSDSYELRLLATLAHALKQLSYLNEQEVHELLSSFLSVVQRVSDVAVVRHWVKTKTALDISHKDTNCLCQRERMVMNATSTMTTEFSSFSPTTSSTTTPKSKNNLGQPQRLYPVSTRRPLSPQQQQQQQHHIQLHQQFTPTLFQVEEGGMSSPTEAPPDGTGISSSVSSLLPQLHVLGLDDSGESKLHFAAKNGLLDACRVLLDQGADANLFNSLGNTPLHLALASGHEDVALLLVSRGASANVRNSEGELPDGIAESVGLSSVAANLRAAARVAMRTPQKQQQQQQQRHKQSYKGDDVKGEGEGGWKR